MTGFIKLNRDILGFEWYSDINVMRFYLHIYILAQFKETALEGLTLKPGQLLSTLEKLSNSTGLTMREVRTCIKKLKTTNRIKVKATNKYTVITITSWHKDQVEDNQKSASPPNEGHSSDKRATTYKNDEELKENPPPPPIKGIIP